jgi:hypothetical protein
MDQVRKLKLQAEIAARRARAAYSTSRIQQVAGAIIAVACVVVGVSDRDWDAVAVSVGIAIGIYVSRGDANP